MAYEFIKKLFGTTEDGKQEALTWNELEKKIEADSKLKLVNLSDGGYVSKDKFDAKDTELSGVRKSLEEANSQIKAFTDQNTDIDSIKKAAQEWETKYNADTNALKAQIEAQERSHQTDMFLSSYKYTSKAAQSGIRADFEKQNFKLKDGIFQGAQEYMKGLMENDDYKGAFVVENSDGQGDAGSQNPLPRFAAGTNGGAGNHSGSNSSLFKFGFQHIVEPPKA